ncbi:MAG: type II toxin-antitoxin system VapC family toxin [Deltaproteobacteria bacterium]|nr:type II toxin-antitoxin system VapC family toxin [Deltaproteobacteria bacterium]
MEIPVIIPDASVILKWAFRSPEEQHQEKALTILNDWCEGKVHLILPKLWSFEVGNVLALKNPQNAQEIMEILIGYRFPEYETTVELCRETFKLIRQYRVTFYDAVYHGVALLNKGTMVTMDKAYYRKAVKSGHVVILEDF